MSTWRDVVTSVRREPNFPMAQPMAAAAITPISTEATLAELSFATNHGTTGNIAPSRKQTNDSDAALSADGSSSGSMPNSSRECTASAFSVDCMTSAAA